MHMRAKNPVFGVAGGIVPAAVRIWVETPCCSEKNLATAPKHGKQHIESSINLRNEV